MSEVGDTVENVTLKSEVVESRSVVVPGGSEVVGVPANGDSITHHIEETVAKIKISSKKQKNTQGCWTEEQRCGHVIVAIPRSRIVDTSDKNGSIDEVMLDALGTMWA